MSCQPQQLSVKWWFVTARETAHHKSVAADHTTWLVLIYVCACNNEGQNDYNVHADDDLNGPFFR